LLTVHQDAHRRIAERLERHKVLRHAELQRLLQPVAEASEPENLARFLCAPE
jgi:hypothetical protein